VRFGTASSRALEFLHFDVPRGLARCGVDVLPEHSGDLTGFNPHRSTFPILLPTSRSACHAKLGETGSEFRTALWRGLNLLIN
jgi:hypothetical protein